MYPIDYLTINNLAIFHPSLTQMNNTVDMSYRSIISLEGVIIVIYYDPRTE